MKEVNSVPSAFPAKERERTVDVCRLLALLDSMVC